MLLRNLALASALVVGAPTAAMAAPTTAVAAETVKTQARTPASSSSDAASYAEREQHDKQAAEFQGGDMIVIGLSGGAILVLLALLIIL
jgi:hypothetical protein